MLKKGKTLILFFKLGMTSDFGVFNQYISCSNNITAKTDQFNFTVTVISVMELETPIKGQGSILLSTVQQITI